MMRSSTLICTLLMLSACSKDGSVLKMKNEGGDLDDGALVHADDCLDEGGEPEAGLWAIVDGPPSCATTNPARPEGNDTLLYFKGSSFSRESAACRADDAFFGATPIGPSSPIEGGFQVPPDAIGYCVINEQTDSEIVMYSTCGIQSAGRAACEETLPSSPSSPTARWEDCPGGELCAPLSPDVCFDSVGDGKAYSMYVDNPDLSCPADSGLDDSQDSLMFTLGAGYGQAIAICVGASTYDANGGLSFGISPVLRRSGSGSDGTLPDLREGDYSPAGAKGYCLFYEGTRQAFALFSMCDEVTPTEQGLKDALTAAEACELEPSIFIPEPRPGTWHDCPGSPLCLD